MLRKILSGIVLSIFVISPVYAQTNIVNDTTIEKVAINGGSDAPNTGVSCIKLSSTVSSQCSDGYLAIKNNNKELISAALTAKASGANVWVSYYDFETTNHCPDIAMTKCVLSTIMIK